MMEIEVMSYLRPRLEEAGGSLGPAGFQGKTSMEIRADGLWKCGSVNQSVR